MGFHNRRRSLFQFAEKKFPALDGLTQLYTQNHKQRCKQPDGKSDKARIDIPKAARFVGHYQVEAFQPKPEQHRERNRKPPERAHAHGRHPPELRQQRPERKHREVPVPLQREVPSPEYEHHEGADHHELFEQAHAAAFRNKQHVHHRKARIDGARDKVQREKRPAPLGHERHRKIETHNRVHPEHQREE